jgi:hypothetical protein
VSNEAIRVPIRHDPGEARETGASGVYPDRMEIAILPKARQIVVTERWFVQLAKTKEHVYGNSLGENRDEAVINNYFSQFRDAALGLWNGKLQLVATEKGHPPVTYELGFRIERATDRHACHWEVRLHLYNKDYSRDFEADSVNWMSGVIELHLNSAALRAINMEVIQVQRHSGVLSKPAVKIISGLQTPVAHEFGHTLGLSPGLTRHSDEYRRREYSDGEIRHGVYRSVMNIGNQIETRHADYIVSQLNRYYGGLRNSSVEFSARKRK